MSKYIKLSEVADNLGISIHTARSWLRNGNIPRQTYFKVGNTYRFNYEQIEGHVLGTNVLPPDEDWSDVEDDKEDAEEDIGEDVEGSVEDAEDEVTEAEPVNIHNLFR